MATIAPVLAYDSVSNSSTVTWTGVSTADTMTSYKLQGRAAEFACVEMSGAAAWGSATVTLKGSNDDSVYITLKDRTNNSVSATADAFFELSTAAKWIKPASSGGTADNVDVIVHLRGK